MHCNISRGLTMIPLGIALLFQALKQCSLIERENQKALLLS